MHRVTLRGGLCCLLYSALTFPVLAQTVLLAPADQVVTTTATQAATTADIIQRFQPPPVTSKLPDLKPVTPVIRSVKPKPKVSVVVEASKRSKAAVRAESKPEITNPTSSSNAAVRTEPPPVVTTIVTSGVVTNAAAITKRKTPQLSPSAVGDLRLVRVRALVKGGALRLAVTTLDRFQQASGTDKDWWLLEQERLQILNLLNDWQAIVVRTTQSKTGLSEKIQQARNDWQVMARLNLHQGDEARRILRDLLWSTPTPQAQFLGSWRRQVVRSYLVAGKFQNAKTAALRYQQEYLPADPAWTYLFARVLLAAEDPATALRWLRSSQTFEGRLLRLQAQLMAGDKPLVIAADARKLMAQLPAQALGLRRELWAVIAAAADRAVDYLGQLQALEQALNIPPQPSDHRLLEPTISDLIVVLQKTGEQLGNQSNLILGEDGPWMELARSELGQRPWRAQGLFAVLTQQGEANFTRRRAHESLIELLFKAKMKSVALQLYADKKWLPSVDVLSDASRYLLAEADMQQGNIAQAAELVKNLVRPPSGVDPLDWILRRARLAVYAGDPETAKRLINNYLQPLTQIGEGAAQRIQQVLFDLQSVSSHRFALQLFRALRERVQSPQLQREILFWMGDSRAALKEYSRAAELYLGSALTAENSFDLWGQSARYKAAGVLVKAGLIEDARRLYKSLLQATADVKRRAQLQRRLQELWLRTAS